MIIECPMCHGSEMVEVTHEPMLHAWWCKYCGQSAVALISRLLKSGLHHLCYPLDRLAMSFPDSTCRVQHILERIFPCRRLYFGERTDNELAAILELPDERP